MLCTDLTERGYAARGAGFVGVGVALGDESSRIGEYTLQIDYRIEVEEVLKGVAADSADEARETRSRVRRWRGDL